MECIRSNAARYWRQEERTDDQVLDSLDMVWGETRGFPEGDYSQAQKNDWAQARAATVRTVRRRGLTPKKEILDLIRSKGVNL